jgi:WD40 repeat protein
MSIIKQGETWSYHPFLPMVEAHTPESVRNVFCLWETEKTVDTYTDNTPAIQYEWFVSLVTYPQANVIAAFAWFMGDYPPKTKPFNGLPGYGTRPESAAISWLLSEQMNFYSYLNLGREIDQFVFSPDSKKMFISGGAQIYTEELGVKGSSALFYTAWNEKTAIALAPDGQKLAVASFGEAKILDAATAAVILEMENAPEFSLVLRLAYSPDGSHLAGADASGSVILWDTITGALIQTLKPPEAMRVQNVAYSPDGHWLAVNCQDKLYVWDLSSGKWAATLNAPRSIWVSFTLDNRFLVYDTLEAATRQVDLVDTATWETAKTFPRYSLHAVSPDGQWLALAIAEPASAEDAHILLIQLANEEQRIIPNFGTQPEYMTFTPDNKTLVVRNQDGYAYFYSLSAIQ